MLYKFLIAALFFSLVTFSLNSCGEKKTEEMETEIEIAKTTQDYDPKIGEGKYKEISLNPSLDKAMAEKGEKISSVKCSSCHKTTEERLVGPGWTGVTSRHNPVWLMNFFTNPEPMIDKDPKLQEQLEICLVRMPNQNISDDEARSILEYMRKIDGVK